ncbi:ABC transporter substrate-binding protein [Brachybacterium hainanense]|uniref:ABC transporter substrate-binding protein n=1 Tax=Brachybacterium hainanense TaxID=1541174 RepID=A0ABV6R8B4_9MICO
MTTPAPLPLSLTRRSLLLGTGGLSLGALAACRAPADPAAAGSGGSGSGAVTYWDVWQSQTPYIENEIALFQEATGIQVQRTQQQTGAYKDLITLGARSGDLPDVRHVSSEPPMNEQVKNGWLTPLNDHVDEEWIRSFPPYTFVEGSNMFDGKIYTAPFVANTTPAMFLFINDQVFRDAGLVDGEGKALIPRTWDEVTQYARTITEKGGGEVFGLGFGNSAFDLLSWWASVFCQAEAPHGGFSMDLRTGSYAMGSDPLAGDFLEMLVGWKDAGYVFPSSMSIDDETARVYFAKGDFGMTVGGNWNQPGWAEDGFTDYSWTTLIGREEKPKAFFYSAPGGDSWALTSALKNTEGAVEWLRWLLGPEAGKRWTQEFNLGLSIHPESVDVDAIEDRNFRDYLVAAEGKQIPGPQPHIRNPDAVKVVPDPVSPGPGDVIAGVYTGQLSDIRGALADLEERMNENHRAAIDAAVAEGAQVSAEDWVFEDWDPMVPYAYDIPEYPTL